MNRVVHNLLHEQEAPVPVPEYHSLLHVYGNLSKNLGVFEAIDKYCLLLDRANHHPKIKPIEIELNNLSIQAMQNRLIYVRRQGKMKNPYDLTPCAGHEYTDKTNERIGGICVT